MIIQAIFLALVGLSFYALSLLSTKVIKRISLGFLIPGALVVGYLIVGLIFFHSYEFNYGAGFILWPGLFLLALSLIIFLIAFIKERSKK